MVLAEEGHTLKKGSKAPDAGKAQEGGFKPISPSQSTSIVPLLVLVLSFCCLSGLAI